MVKSSGVGWWVAHVIIVKKIRILDFGLIFWTQTLDSGLQASDLGLQTWDFGLRPVNSFCMMLDTRNVPLTHGW